MYPSLSTGVRVNRLPAWLTVFLVSWAVSVPWAVVHGPVSPEWVVFQALGAGVIPAMAGWGTLWRTKGNLKGAVWGSVWAAVVLLLLQVWSQLR
jgi:hypothetical protein